MHNVFSYYALTDAFRKRVESVADGPVEYIAVGQLRNLGIRKLLARIRKLKSDRITVAIEHENARPLAGPLLLLAVASGSRCVEVLWPDGTRVAATYAQVSRHLGKVVGAQILGRMAVYRSGRKLRELERCRTSYVLPARRSEKAVLYLDANLSLGLTAGGSIGHTQGVIEALAKKGLEVDYASCKMIPTAMSGTRWLRVEPVDPYGIPGEINIYTYNRIYERHVKEFLQRRNYSFIYQRMSTHNFTGAAMRARTGLPCVLEYNGSEAWAAANWTERLQMHELAARAEKVALTHADLVVTVSSVLGDQVKAAGVRPERIVVYPNCIDPDVFSPGRFSATQRQTMRGRLGIANDARVATFIGTFGTWHGVDFLARTIRRLVDEQGAYLARHRLHFLLVGDGPRMAEVKEAVGHPPYDRFVTLTGLVPQGEAPDYLAISDLFLSPHMPNPDGTSFFGSPTKLFEYMAMERPIVAADLDQIGEILRGRLSRQGGCAPEPLGALFRPGDQDAFIAAVQHVLDNPELAAATAQNARREAVTAFTWERHVEAFLDRMESLCMFKDR
jgi:glycosyltransferase involved in cell wall biosynthesis